MLVSLPSTAGGNPWGMPPRPRRGWSLSALYTRRSGSTPIASALSAAQELHDHLVVLLGVFPLRPVRRIGDAIVLGVGDQRGQALAHVRPRPGVLVRPEHQS